ncbi:MAG TPA: histidine kinase [Solirubrobacteraceae bacterium]|nr:histidine kinase [Solirubrobacteraceae bacterium]
MTDPPRTMDSATATHERRRRYVPLLHRVAGINVLLLLVAVGGTIAVLVPGHESSYRIDEEGVALLAAVILVVLLNVFLLGRVVRPLQRLTAVTRSVDLTDPPPSVPDARRDSEAGELALSFNEMLTRLQSERREATGRVLAGQEAERLRIAQELHDQVGQELTAALLLLARVESRTPEDLRSAVAEAQEAVRTSLEDVRRIAIELRPEALDDLGLDSALAVLSERFAQRSGLEVSYRAAGPLPKLSPEAELVIYRVAQEALTNVARHSGSRQAELILQPDDGQLVLSVRDEGKGLGQGQTDGSGIRGMRERARLIGAAVEVRNARPGTEVRLRVPLGESA